MSVNGVSPPGPAREGERPRAAQAEAPTRLKAAFFQAALAGEPSAGAQVPAARPVTPAQPLRGFDPEAPAPARTLRPGSLIDLKV